MNHVEFEFQRKGTKERKVHFKRMAAFVLCLCMVLTTVEIPVRAEETGQAKVMNASGAYAYVTPDIIAPDVEFEYTEKEDGTLEINKAICGEDGTEVIIPSEIDGKLVTSIGERAF